MTILLRLMAYPPTDLAHLAGGSPLTPTPENPPRLSCLLHTSLLSAGYALDVRVQGARVPGQPEEGQQVFSWQCVAGDAIRLTLWHHGRSQREWLGCWNGEHALLHAGTLPVQVFMAGQPQPEVDPTELVPLLSPSQHNGHTEVSVPDELHILAQSPSVLEEHESASERDDEGQISGGAPSAERPTGDDDGGIEEPNSMPMNNALAHAPDGISETASTLTDTPFPFQAPAGARIAAWHADPTAGGASLETLTTLLAQMPAKTLLVDLRHHPRKAARFQETGSLSKQALRQTFGARYWDRGWAIRTVQQALPAPTLARWRSVVTNPRDPEGLPLLVERLQRGFSLLLVDSIAQYEESVRAAVIAALQQDVGNLTLGPLS